MISLQMLTSNNEYSYGHYLLESYYTIFLTAISASVGIDDDDNLYTAEDFLNAACNKIGEDENCS